MRFPGRRDGVPGELAEQMHKAEALTASNKRLALFIAFNYGGRAEILDAAKRFTGGDEEEFRACLYAPEMHDTRPHHPHRQRATTLELPAVASRLLRAYVPRRAVARLHETIPPDCLAEFSERQHHFNEQGSEGQNHTRHPLVP